MGHGTGQKLERRGLGVEPIWCSRALAVTVLVWYCIGNLGKLWRSWALGWGCALGRDRCVSGGPSLPLVTSSRV
jgi:hypothetical protein